MANTTSTPKTGGLSVARKGNNIVLTWTPIKNCTDQDIKVFVTEDKKERQVQKRDLGKNTKSFTYTINPANYNPTVASKTLNAVSFSLARKQKNKKESSFSEKKTFKLAVPGIPEYVAPSMDSTNHDRFTYSWNRNSNDGDANTTDKMFARFDWETCLVDEKKQPNWNLVKTQKIQTINNTTGALQTNQPSYGTRSISGPTSVIIVETQADIAARKRRYFRVRSRGPAGNSNYQTSWHQLGGSDSIVIQSDTTTYLGSDSTGTSGRVKLNIPAVNPGDSIQVEYAITNPYVTSKTEGDTVKSDLTLPNDFSGWTVGDTFTGVGKPDIYTFKYPAQIVEDTMLFLRINRIHDNITSYGVPFLMNHTDSETTETATFIGPLSEPTLSSVSVNETTKEVTISAVNNTNLASGGNKSFIAVYQSINNTDEDVIGIIPYSNGDTSVTFPGDWDDDDSPAFGIQCFVADYSPVNRKESGATIYKIGTPLMQSSGIIWQRDLVSKPPEITSLTRYNSTTALITWDWTWAQADSAEISWSDNEIIWDSTDEPSSYILTNTRNGSRYVTGLSPTTYYFRIRFIKTEGDTTIFGKYSKTEKLLMSSAPNIPTLTLSDEDNVVGMNDEVTAYWGYESTDGTPQSSAELAEATRETVNDEWTYTPLPDAVAETATKYTFTPSQFGWTDGTIHYICVRVKSASGQNSEGWSNPVAINIAPLPELTVTGIGETSDDSIKKDADGYYILQKMPIEFLVTGSGKAGICSVTIARTQDYDIERPDDTKIIGFEGETIVSKLFDPDDDGVAHVSITVDDLIGRLDNTAYYRMTVAITDEYKQSDEKIYDFSVEWDYYAQMPSATIAIDTENDVALIRPSAPSEVDEGDYCQIYRLSADEPQLILDNGSFDTEYVDPYPTYGYFGGYRIVYVTKYGDYKTSENLIAMTEYSKAGNDEDIDQYDRFLVSVRFGDNVVEFPGNIALNASWAKDFQTTKYLGGSIQGDWNPGVQRTGTITGVVPVQQEAETVYGLRLLADYSGVCHVRTPEGSNFYADVQVKDDREERWVNKISKITLSYTKVDALEEELEVRE